MESSEGRGGARLPQDSNTANSRPDTAGRREARSGKAENFITHSCALLCELLILVGLETSGASGCGAGPARPQHPPAHPTILLADIKLSK